MEGDINKKQESKKQEYKKTKKKDVFHEEKKKVDETEDKTVLDVDRDFLTEDQVFQRRDSITRTPPKKDKGEQPLVSAYLVPHRYRTNSLPEGNIGKPKVIPTTSTKRQREEEECETKSFTEKISLILKASKDLFHLTEVNTTTKLDIKRGAKSLYWQMVKLAGDIKEEQEKKVQGSKKRAVSRNTSEVNTQTEEMDVTVKNTVRKEMKTIGTQTEDDDVLEKNSKIKAALKGEGLEAISYILDETWPDEVFNKTEIIEPDPGYLQNGDCALMINPKNFDKEQLVLGLVNKFDGLRNVIEKCEGQSDYIIETCRRKTKKGDSGESSCAVYVLPVGDGEKDDTRNEQYKRLVELKEMTNSRPSETIKLVIGEDVNVMLTRKMAEHVFVNGSYIKLLTAKPTSAPNRNRKKPNREQALVTVKTGNKSYADLVKGLKQEVDIPGLGVNIKKMKKTEQGDLQLTVEGGDKVAQKLKEEIKRKISTVTVSAKTLGAKTLNIYGLDPTVTAEELKLQIGNTAKISAEEVRVRSLREGRYGMRTAIIEVSRKPANYLVKLGKSRIGWTECTFKERIQLQRCYNCLEYGHISRECSAKTSRRAECINCGQLGHKSKECKNPVFCNSCRTDGHRADQMRCPLFNKLVKEKRKNVFGNSSAKQPAAGGENNKNGSCN